MAHKQPRLRLAGRLPEPVQRTRRYYVEHPDVAPYTRFRPTPQFYREMVWRGTYTADIWGCPWQCAGCWSHFGNVAKRVVFECTPAQVVDNLVGGMTANRQGGARISSGDSGYWWEHVRAVIDEFLERTAAKRLRLSNGSTYLERLTLVVETSGGIGIRPEQLLDIERVHGERAAGIILSVGMKATNPEQLKRLTGLGDAAGAHRRQLELMRTVLSMEHVRPSVTFLDAYSPQEEFDELVEEFEQLRPGVGNDVTRFPYRNYTR